MHLWIIRIGNTVPGPVSQEQNGTGPRRDLSDQMIVRCHRQRGVAVFTATPPPGRNGLEDM